MDIRRYEWSVVNSNSWLIVEENDGLLFDVVDNKDLEKKISTLDSLTIILTHSHFDHIIGLNKIRNLLPKTRVICTQNCSKYIGNIYRNMSSTATAFLSFYEAGKQLNTSIEPFVCGEADETFFDRMTLSWKNYSVVLESCYGHGDDCLIAIVDGKYMFSGDTLLSIPTVTRFPRGNTKRFFYEDIPLIMGYQPDVVFPGHGIEGCMIDMINVNRRMNKEDLKRDKNFSIGWTNK